MTPAANAPPPAGGASPDPTYRPLRALGMDVTRSHWQLRKVLEDTLGREFAQLFAEPLREDGDGRTDWYVQGAPPVHPLSSLDAGTKTAVVEQLVARLDAIDRLAADCEAEGTAAKVRLAGFLRMAVQFPDIDCIHVVDGEPVLFHWGHQADDRRTVERGDLLALIETERTGRVRPPEPPTPSAPPAPPAGTAVPDDDEILRRVEQAGGQVSGTVTISLAWNNDTDLDLHLDCPGGTKIYYGNAETEAGTLDVDMNAGGTIVDHPVENIALSDPPVPGAYRVKVDNYVSRSAGDAGTQFVVRLQIGSDVRSFTGVARPDAASAAEVCRFEISPDGRCRVLDHPSGSDAQELE